MPGSVRTTQSGFDYDAGVYTTSGWRDLYPRLRRLRRSDWSRFVAGGGRGGTRDNLREPSLLCSREQLLRYREGVAGSSLLHAVI